MFIQTFITSRVPINTTFIVQLLNVNCAIYHRFTVTKKDRSLL